VGAHREDLRRNDQLRSWPVTATIDAAALAHLQSWQGKSEATPDTATAAPVRALSATLDRDDPAPVPGTPVPPLWHWLYFLPHARQSEIGPDGHPKRGGFLPPVPLPRRMWAGGRLRWETGNLLQVGQALERLSTIRSVTHKAGRSGELLFVLVEHRFSNANGLSLTEEHDIVLLFRYSALTFNGHRIHYDRQYVTQVEGYPGLIVHGPLIATLLVDLLRRSLPGAQVAAFDFKAVRPTFDLHPFSVHGKPREDGRTIDLWAQDHEGFLTMQATATLA
jgi:3-methylfumaryl-CoA hydratase